MVFCPNCGKKNSEENKFCYYCGESLVFKENTKNTNKNYNSNLNNNNSNKEFYKNRLKIIDVLFYKKDENQREYISKRKIICCLINLFWISIGIYTGFRNAPNAFQAITTGIVVGIFFGLMASIPTYFILTIIKWIYKKIG